MPCFKGLALSIHTPDGPLPEHSIQKQSRAGRISAYIPVPPAKVPADSLTGQPEQSSFAVSITLLTPGQKVPYSAPKATEQDPYPTGVTVGGLPGSWGARGNYTPVIPPYIPRTSSQNETIAAYIYFDGRAKEEVATLLRRGEETWVNSRWVSVPESEGGGLAEREFLFREVGLERWLNGLDLVGKNKAAKIEKRHQKLEKKRRIKKEEEDSDDDGHERKARFDPNGVLRYGNGQTSPIESVPEERDILLSDDSSDDEPPQSEAAGQIKIALFRVLASGEIKRGEYEPQFDAHDEAGETNDGDADIDHTTTFAKPKTLDPKTISTQTVTGLDAPDSPYAVFTFFYRGEKQLQKMGILEVPEGQKSPVATKRKSVDFTKLGALNKFGTVGFSKYRERPAASKKKASNEDDDAMDSDEDEERAAKDADENEQQDPNGKLLNPEDARKQVELAEGVRQIKLKRAHSGEGLGDVRKSPHVANIDSPTVGTPQSAMSTAAAAGTPPELDNHDVPGSDIASPFKRQRASVDGLDAAVMMSPETAQSSTHAALLPTVQEPIVSSNGIATSTPSQPGQVLPESKAQDEDEEL